MRTLLLSFCIAAVALLARPVHAERSALFAGIGRPIDLWSQRIVGSG